MQSVHLYRTPQPELQLAGDVHTNKPTIKVATHLSLEADFLSSESTVKWKTGKLKAIELHFLCIVHRALTLTTLQYIHAYVHVCILILYILE